MYMYIHMHIGEGPPVPTPKYIYKSENDNLFLHICTEFVRKVEIKKDPDETEVKQTCGGEPVSDLEIYITKICNFIC